MFQKESIEIPQNIIKLLGTSGDKRKIAEQEMENFIRSNAGDLKNEEEVKKLIKSFKSQFLDPTALQHLRKAAIFGLMKLINMLFPGGPGGVGANPEIIKQTINYILQGFRDSDPKIVYSAGTCMFNIMKILPNSYILRHFNDIFEGLLTLYTNLDNDVRSLASELDNKLKDILRDSMSNESEDEFNLQGFLQTIYEKIGANHPGVKKFIVNWIGFIDTIPEIELLEELHELLPGLFKMLSEVQKDVSLCAEKCLKDFYDEVRNNFEKLSYEEENKILEILIEQTQSQKDQTKQTGFEWISMFLQKYSSILSSNKINHMRNATSQVKTIPQIKDKTINIVAQIKNTNIIKQDNLTLTSEFEAEVVERKVPFNLFPDILESILNSINSPNENISKLANNSNNTLLSIIEYYTESNSMNIKLFEEKLRMHPNMDRETTLEIILTWIKKLFKKFNENMYSSLDTFIEHFTKILNHKNDEIFNSLLGILCEIAKFKEGNIEIIMRKILEKLCLNKSLLNTKGLSILKQLCTILPVDRVYLTFAEVLLKMKDLEFIDNMINILDIFLLTHDETDQIRKMLRNLRKKNGNKEEKLFFEKLFTTWSFNPVSTIVLCIISEYFELSYHLILKFGSIKLDNEKFVQLAQLIQLLESNIFNHIRVLLLEPLKNNYLVKTLYGILMILPQGKAYQALSKRLKNVEMLYKLDNDLIEKKSPEIDKDELNYFLAIFCQRHNL